MVDYHIDGGTLSSSKEWLECMRSIKAGAANRAAHSASGARKKQLVSFEDATGLQKAGHRLFKVSMPSASKKGKRCVAKLAFDYFLHLLFDFRLRRQNEIWILEQECERCNKRRARGGRTTPMASFGDGIL
jgi:hypothetical protein